MWQFLPAEEAAPNWLVDSVTVLRLGLLVAMAVIVIRDMLQTDGRLTAPGRQGDLVRAAHSGADPLAGILAAKEPGARRLTSKKRKRRNHGEEEARWEEPQRSRARNGLRES